VRGRWALFLLVVGIVYGQSVEDARRLAEKGRLRDALVILQEVLRNDSDNLNAHLLYQDVMMKLGRYEEAKGEYEDMAERHTGNALYQFLAARLQRESHRRIELLQKALKADGGFEPARRALARELFLVRDYKGAVEHLNWILKKDEKDLEALLLLAAIERERSRYDEAMKYLRRAAEANPQSPVPLVEMGRVEQERAHFAEAVKHFEEASKRGMLDWQALLGWGDSLVGLGKKKEAVAVWRRALALPLTPEQFAVFANRCATLFVRPPTKELQQPLQKARKLATTDPKKALQLLENLNKQSPDNPVLLSAFAAVAMLAGEPNRAIKAAQKALKLAPDYFEPFFILGIYHSITRSDDEALKNLRRAEQLNPFHAETVRELGFVLVRKGRPFEAADLATRYWRLTGNAQRAAELRLQAELNIHHKEFLLHEEKTEDATLTLWRGLEPAIPGYRLLFRIDLHKNRKLLRRFLVMLEEQTLDTQQGPQTMQRWLLIESPLKEGQMPVTHKSFFLPPKKEEVLKAVREVLKKK